MSKQIALTFDDGPNTTTTLEVLDKLQKYNVVASFFLIADNITQESISSVKREFEMGCEIQNHSKTHSFMTELSPEEIKAEIEYCSQKIYDIVGVYPKFFRPPYICVDDKMYENIDLPFICGYGGRDWEPDVDALTRASLILDSVDDGAIILLHDLLGNDETVKALDILIPTLKERGYEFVTISKLFENKGITPKAHSGIVYSSVFDNKKYVKED